MTTIASYTDAARPPGGAGWLPPPSSPPPWPSEPRRYIPQSPVPSRP
jgi:hypothetical protein